MTDFKTVYGTNGYSVMLMNDEGAWKEIADSMVIELQQFINGERSLDETSFQTEEAPCKIKIVNGVIMVADDSDSVDRRLINGSVNDLSIDQPVSDKPKFVIVYDEDQDGIANTERQIFEHTEEENAWNYFKQVVANGSKEVLMCRVVAMHNLDFARSFLSLKTCFIQ